jgi:MoaA/NifB/PqqE/SkfB family radical SAM enzyme
MDMDPEVARNMIDQLSDMGTQRLLFSGSGEPFLHPEFLALCERAKRRGMMCTINTNGLLLDHETSERLVQMQFDRLRVTTLAGSPDVYSATHPGMPGHTLEKIKDNLLHLAEKKVAQNADNPKVQMVNIIFSQNCDDLFEFTHLAEEVKADQIHFRPISDLGDEGLNHLALSSEQQSQVRADLLEIRKELNVKNIKHNIENYLRISHTRLDTSALYRIIPCYYGWFAIRIEVNGLVYPCCRCYVPLSETDGIDIKKIWNGENYRRFREEAIKININQPPVKGCGCDNCPHYTVNLRAFRLLHPIKAKTKKLFTLDFIEDRVK